MEAAAPAGEMPPLTETIRGVLLLDLLVLLLLLLGGPETPSLLLLVLPGEGHCSVAPEERRLGEALPPADAAVAAAATESFV